MDQSYTDLFKWRRKTNPLGGSRPKNSNVQSWIKKVEAESERAVREAYGGDILSDDLYDNVYADDQALYEAQEVVNGWLTGQKRNNIDLEVDIKDEAWSSTASSASHYLDDNDDDTSHLSSVRDRLFRETNLYSDKQQDFALDRGILHREQPVAYSDLDIEDVDDSILVNDVIQGMLTKQIIPDSIMKDLDSKPNSKVKDPRPKMELRHKEVKERSVARNKKLERERREHLTRREVEQQAKEEIKREERERKIRQKHEEDALKAEMVKIRREMEDERRMLKEQEARKKEVLQQARNEIQEELKRKREAEEREKQRRHAAEEQMRQRIIKELEEQSFQEMKQNLKILHRHFSAWYNLVVERSVQSGKARAVSDWKTKLKAWNAWRAYVACIKSDKEARMAEDLMKEKYRKEQMAIHHDSQKCLKRAFYSWTVYCKHRKDKHLLKQQHQQNAVKMAKFLEAAATGKLWGEADEKMVEPLNLEEQDDDEKPMQSLQIKSHRSEEVLPVEKRGNAFLLHAKNSNVKNNNNNDNSNDNTNHIIHKNQFNNSSRKRTVSLKRDVLPPQSTEIDQKKPSHARKLSLDSRSKHPANPSRTTTSDTERTDESSTSSRQPNSNRSYISSEGGFLSDNDLSTGRGSVMTSSSSRQSSCRKPIIKSDKPATKPLQLAMEERAKLRAERKAKIEEEKQRRDEERLQMLRQAEQARIQKEQEEKEEKIRQRKEEKRLERERELEKQQRIEHSKQQNLTAKSHHERQLLLRYGFEPWRRLIQINKLNHQIADKFHHGLLQRKILHEWLQVAQQARCEREEIADQFFDKLLLRRCICSWRKSRHHMQHLSKVARLHARSLLMRRVFRAWTDHVTDERLLMLAKESDAYDHDLKRISKHYFHEWREFVTSTKDEREREKRRSELRKKVQSWLPDFSSSNVT